MSPLWNLLGRLQRLPEKMRLGYQCMRAPYFRWVPPGHFYSALPDMKEVEERADTIFAAPPPTLPAIDLNREGQLELLQHFREYYKFLPFERSANPRSRFFRPNGSFPFQDAFTLYAMLRHGQPKRLVEVGCGSSSCVILDTCEALKLNTQLTFIEPYPELLLARVRPEDRSRFELKAQKLQDVPRELFASLEAGDILFIDTSHVSKVGSDVNWIFFELLPLLRPGVVVHFHDIFYPFEYPRAWFGKGMFWNEAYLLRALLMFNPAFQILMFNSYLRECLPEQLRGWGSLCLEDPGASLWLRRL